MKEEYNNNLKEFKPDVIGRGHKLMSVEKYQIGRDSNLVLRKRKTLTVKTNFFCSKYNSLTPHIMNII